MDQNKINSILFKPCVTNVHEKEQLVLPFRKEISSVTTMDLDGKEINTEETVISIILIDDSITCSFTIIEDFIVVDEDNLLNAFRIVEQNEYINKIVSLQQILSEQIHAIHKEMERTQNAASVIYGTLNRFLYSDKSKKGEVPKPKATKEISDIVGYHQRVLKKGEAVKIWEAIENIIVQNIDINTNDDKTMESLRKNIEFAILESLPPDISMGDCEINMDRVKQKIEELKNER